ncbi:sensor histidine kinase [Niabella terrae]
MNKIRRISMHGGGWLLFSFLMASFLQNGDASGISYSRIIFSAPFLGFIFFYIALFYLNTKLLIPIFFLKKKYLSYILIAILLLLTCLWLSPFDRVMQPLRPALSGRAAHEYRTPPQLPPGETTAPRGPAGGPPVHRNYQPGIPPPGRPTASSIPLDIISLILFFMTLAGSSLLVLSRQWRIAENNKSKAEVQKIRAEMAFLKAQVSPHFLFNTLNNIYALALTKSDKTPAALLRLSNIMRYITDEASQDFVPLEKEIAAINDYIELQKLRMGKMTGLQYSLKGVYVGTRLAPLVLMPFIENAFKHGISKNQPSRIDISIYADQKVITLHTRNLLLRNLMGEQRDGTGLSNVQQRLELLYPGAYTLKTGAEGDYFVVDLQINIAGSWN